MMCGKSEGFGKRKVQDREDREITRDGGQARPLKIIPTYLCIGKLLNLPRYPL